MKKASRQFLIKELITQKHIGSQQQLLQELKQRGKTINQGTLSRDLHEMGISRISTPSGTRYALGAPESGLEERTRTLLSYEVQSISANESLVIVRTLPGRAQGVAEMIDSLSLGGILATLAGDNTIFIAPVSAKKIGAIVKDLKEFIAQE